MEKNDVGKDVHLMVIGRLDLLDLGVKIIDNLNNDMTLNLTMGCYANVDLTWRLEPRHGWARGENNRDICGYFDRKH